MFQLPQKTQPIVSPRAQKKKRRRRKTHVTQPTTDDVSITKENDVEIEWANRYSICMTNKVIIRC